MAAKVMMIEIDVDDQFTFRELIAETNAVLAECLNIDHFDAQIQVEPATGSLPSIFDFDVNSALFPSSTNIALMDIEKDYSPAWFAIACSYKIGKWGYPAEYLMVAVVTCAIGRLIGKPVIQLDEVWIDNKHFDEEDCLETDKFISIFKKDVEFFEDFTSDFAN